MKSLDKIYAPYLKNPFAPGAALFHKRSKVYFFRGNEYLRYDDRKKKHEVKWGYPKRVQVTLECQECKRRNYITTKSKVNSNSEFIT